MKRRNFLRTAGLLALSAAVPEKAFPFFQKDAALSGKSAAAFPEKPFPFSRKGLAMDFEPYPLELKHVFTVASYSRTATPGVQVRVGYEGLVGYGEASMPPYLGETVDSVVAFLSKVDLSRFSDPFSKTGSSFVKALYTIRCLHHSLRRLCRFIEHDLSITPCHLFADRVFQFFHCGLAHLRSNVISPRVCLKPEDHFFRSLLCQRGRAFRKVFRYGNNHIISSLLKTFFSIFV